MAKTPSNSGGDPVNRSVSITGTPALPPPIAQAPAPDKVERSVGEASSNASLLDAIRDSSRTVCSKLDVIVHETKAFHKDFNALAKSMDPMLKYYQKKFSKWVQVEEDFFRLGLRVLATYKGETAKLSDYEKTKYGEKKEGPARGADGKFIPGGVDRRDADNGKSFEAIWKSRFKAFAEYTGAPLKLVDVLFAKMLGGISAGIAARKAAAAKKLEDAKLEEAARLQAIELEKQEALKAIEEEKAAQKQAAEDASKLDEYFSRFRSMLDDKWPDGEEGGASVLYADLIAVDAMLIGTLVIDTLVVGSFGMAEEEEPMRSVVPEPSEVLMLPAPFTNSMDDLAEEIPEFVFGINDFEEVARSAEVFPKITDVLMRTVQPEPVERLMLPAPGSSVSSAEGLGGVSPQGPDQADILDDTQDNLELLFGSVRSFFDGPENTPVGKFLTALLSGGGGSGSSWDGSIKLPPWVQILLTILAIGGMIIFAAIAAGVLLVGAGIAAIGLSIAAAILLLATGVTAILLVIAATLLIAALLIGYLGYVIITFVASVLKSIASFIDRLLTAIIDFIEDPGAWIEKFVTGIMNAIDRVVETFKNIISTVIELIAKAFNEIPILKTIAEGFDSLVKSVTGLVDTITTVIGDLLKGVAANLIKVFDAVTSGGIKIYEALSGIILEALNFVKTAVQTVAGVLTAILGIVAGVLLTAVVKVIAGLSGLAAAIANILSGPKAMKEAYQEAYDTSVGSSAGMIEVVSKNLSNDVARNIVAATGRMVKEDLGVTDKARMKEVADRVAATPVGGPVDNRRNSTNTSFTQSMPSFSTIPIYGGGF